MYKKKNYKKKPDGLTDKQAKSVAKIAKRVTEKAAETKEHSYGVIPVVIYDGAGSLTSNITAIAQGVGDNLRIGDEITLKAIEIRMNFFNGTGVNSNHWVNWRVIIFQYNDKDNVPNLGEMLKTTVANEGNTYGAMSSYNIDYKQTYNILYDKTIQTTGTQGLAYTGDADSSAHWRFHKFTVPLKYCKKKIRYEAGAVGDATNGVYMAITTDRSTVGTNPSVKYHVDIHYTDM